jgi:hypothetical protein
LGNFVGKILGGIARAGIFRGGKRDQVMFFPSTASTSTSTSRFSTSTTTNQTLASTNKDKEKTTESKTDSNPEFLNKTLHIVEDLLRGKVEDEVFRLLFDDHYDAHHRPTTETTHHHNHNPHPRSQRQRQSIINLYPLPKSLSHSSCSSPYNNGITPHVDLPGRYGDGIIGVCLGSGVALGFDEVDLGCVSGGEEGGLWGEGVEEEEDEEQEEEDGDEEEEGEVADERAPPHTESQFPAYPPPPSKSNSTNLRKNKKMPKTKIKKKKRPTSYEVYLPKGTIYILSGEARWSWMPGLKGVSMWITSPGERSSAGQSSGILFTPVRRWWMERTPWVP